MTAKYFKYNHFLVLSVFPIMLQYSCLVTEITQSWSADICPKPNNIAGNYYGARSDWYAVFIKMQINKIPEELR